MTKRSLLLFTLLALAGSVFAADKVRELESERQQLLEILDQKLESTPYVVIDTHDNNLSLMQDQRILLESICATGSARKLEGPKRWKHQWQFETPKGRFSVLRKVVNPIWTKPEWVFIESGEEIPIFAEDPRRFQRGVLGEYAIYFAKDYMIHGTLYEMNLGKNITHGCVRVGTDDLQFLFDRLEVGWPIYVY